VIDLKSETTIALAGAARLLPPARLDRPVTVSCVLRWILDGVRLPSGEVIRLQAIRVGGRWLTSVEALQRFAEQQTPKLDAAESPPRPRTAAQRERADKRAAAELDRMGI
jgi:hypothetical protein